MMEAYKKYPDPSGKENSPRARGDGDRDYKDQWVHFFVEFQIIALVLKVLKISDYFKLKSCNIN